MPPASATARLLSRRGVLSPGAQDDPAGGLRRIEHGHRRSSHWEAEVGEIRVRGGVRGRPRARGGSGPDRTHPTPVYAVPSPADPVGAAAVVRAGGDRGGQGGVHDAAPPTSSPVLPAAVTTTTPASAAPKATSSGVTMLCVDPVTE